MQTASVVPSHRSLWFSGGPADPVPLFARPAEVIKCSL
jgi:hypothetical protein